ncbi:hypothetical protein CBR_g33954 [Chara braunii]|uniref:Uncharacterized protein n=1 Tax=Chara braunii TaxID=69332 RepID=A0A388LHI3_CHABU|nr:hypothetical protein CBR_g33954 [Chara braunii]|eukprot:GBG81776.1 hypothetical protein CBR_g33954 [Chara braunii]
MKVAADAGGDWAKFKAEMQRRFKLGDDLLTETDLEMLQRDEFSTVGAFATTFEKMTKRVPGLAEEEQCATFLGHFKNWEASSLTKKATPGKKLTWAAIKEGVIEGELDQVDIFQMRQARKKRKALEATTSDGRDFRKLIEDAVVQLEAEKEAKRKTMAAPQTKGHTIKFCHIRRNDEDEGLISTNYDGDMYDKWGYHLDPKIPGGTRKEALRRAEAGAPPNPPTMFRIWQEKEVRSIIRVEEIGESEEVEQERKNGTTKGESIIVDSDDEIEEDCWGRHATFPIESFLKTWRRQDLEMELTFEELLALRARMIGVIEDRIEEAASRTADSRTKDKFRWDKMALLRKEPLKVGDVVLLYDSSLEKQWSRKLGKRWLGPYRIARCGEHGMYQIEELNGTAWKDWVSDSRLKKFVARDEMSLDPTSLTPFGEAMPRGKGGAGPVGPPQGAARQRVQGWTRREDRPPIFRGGNVELFLVEFEKHANEFRWDGARMRREVRGEGEWAEAIARYVWESATWQEFERKMEGIHPSPVGRDGVPIRFDGTNLDEFLWAYDQFAVEQNIAPETREDQPMTEAGPEGPHESPRQEMDEDQAAKEKELEKQQRAAREQEIKAEIRGKNLEELHKRMEQGERPVNLKDRKGKSVSSQQEEDPPLLSEAWKNFDKLMEVAKGPGAHQQEMGVKLVFADLLTLKGVMKEGFAAAKASYQKVGERLTKVAWKVYDQKVEWEREIKDLKENQETQDRELNAMKDSAEDTFRSQKVEEKADLQEGEDVPLLDKEMLQPEEVSAKEEAKGEEPEWQMPSIVALQRARGGLGAAQQAENARDERMLPITQEAAEEQVVKRVEVETELGAGQGVCQEPIIPQDMPMVAGLEEALG